MASSNLLIGGIELGCNIRGVSYIGAVCLTSVLCLLAY
uniref:Uncharacterized protein n=1 Tax=viral metagenome TaxID=1070528 RepID=A0A6C0JXC6_9ZZZZ